jgi:hypothetical protein
MLDNPAMRSSLVRTGRQLGKDVWETLSASYLQRAFHGDAIYQRFMVELVREIAPARLVETGTYFGDSTRYLASRFPHLRIDTCEINSEFAVRARRRLARFRNVHLVVGTSESFISTLLEDWDQAQTLMLFLDAHWYDYWPLEDEVRRIARSGVRAVFVIDDFEVPSRPEFGFDVEGLDSQATADGPRRVCGLELITPCFNERNQYHALLPTYSHADAFGDSVGTLRGHIAVFQNLEAEFGSLRTAGRVAALHYGPVDI